MPAARAQSVAAVYASASGLLRSQTLSAVSDAFPRIVGVDWRLDYEIRSSVVERIDEPRFLVSLKTSRGVGSAEVRFAPPCMGLRGPVRPPTLAIVRQDSDVKFTCSVNEMTDLVTKLRDATKQVERILR